MYKNNGLHNTNIEVISPLPTPKEIKSALPLTETAWNTVSDARSEIEKIFLCEDPRLIAIAGPCSLHNTEEALRYAQKLASLAKELKDQLLIVMRLCGDKPRTGKAWTGFLNDPNMDGSCNISTGWMEYRKLAIKILDLGLPIGCEILDAENFQRVDDIPSYGWIGARNVGGQRERQIASAISTAIGFKNHHIAGVKIALDAMSVAIRSNVFVASNDGGRASRFVTSGNRLSHLIHRGTDAGINYDVESITKSVHELTRRGLLSRIIVDASHGNSKKDHKNQTKVIADLINQVVSVGQVVSGSMSHIAGFMYESYLEDGNQPIPKDLSDLKPDISVTDGCDGWQTTERVLREVHAKLSQRK